jgi:predicted aspartyl protease
VGLYSTRNCVTYDRTVVPNRPTVEVAVEAPISRSHVRFEAPIDTGFSGYLLLPLDQYSSLSESELPSDHFLTYNTVIGRVQLRRSPVILEIHGKRLSSFVETPVAGTGKLLVGRRVLAELRIALLGPESKTCLLEERPRK